MGDTNIKHKVIETVKRVILYGLIPICIFINHPALISAKENLEYKLNINQPTFSEIKDKIDNRTKKKIEELVLEDNNNRYTEIAGIVTIKNNDLCFYVIPTSNEKNARLLETYKDDWKSFYEYIIKNKKDFVEITKTRENLVDAIIERLENTNIDIETKNKLTNFMINSYIDSSNDVSFHGYNDFFKFYFKNLNPKGDYVGDFHIHNNGGDISKEDIRSSNIQRQYVIIAKDGGFELVDIVKGNVQRAEFKY